MAGGTPGSGRVRTFRVAPSTPGPPWLRWLLAAVGGVPLTVAGVVRVSRGDLLGLLVLALVVLLVLGLVRVRGLVVGIDVDATGITWRPGRRSHPWDELASVEPRGPWRQTPAVRTRGGTELGLLGMPDDDVDLVRAVVEQGPAAGTERDDVPALHQLLAGTDVAPSPAPAPPPLARRRPTVPLVAVGAVLVLLSQLGHLLLGGTAELVASLLVVPGIALLVAAGVVAVRASGAEHDRRHGGSPPG